MRRAGAWVAATAAALVVLGGCTSDPNSVAAQAKAGDRKGYVAGDGSIEQIAVAKRGKPVQLSGTLLDGSDWSMAKVSGKVVVINVWGSWCPPCREEAPGLQQAWASYAGGMKPVAFLGIDFRESPELGAAFIRSRKITYPSLTDESGVLQLALQGKAQTVPSSLVLDRQGRIAAVVSGPATATTLTGLVDDVLAGTGG